MDELGIILTLGLAIFALLRIIKSWRHKKSMILSSAAALIGALLGILALGWPQGMIVGLAASAVAPYALQRWINNVPAPAVERTESEETSPPQAEKRGE